jgi:hypothetical protein
MTDKQLPGVSWMLAPVLFFVVVGYQAAGAS